MLYTVRCATGIAHQTLRILEITMDMETLMALIGGSATLIIGLLAGGIALCTAGIVVIGLVGGFGALAFWTKKAGEEDKALNKAAQAWPSTTGEVKKSRVEVHGYDHVNTVPFVEYEYSINGTGYVSSEIYAGGLYLRDTARGKSESPYDLIERYPVGMQVTVYYDPANPAKSALER
jgi:hypothetical protein